MWAFRGLDAFEGRSRIEAWLRRITVNVALSRLRQLKRLAEQPIASCCRSSTALIAALRRVGCILLPSIALWRATSDVREKIGELPDIYRVV